MKYLLLLVAILSFTGIAYAESKGNKECLEKASKALESDKANILCDGAINDFPLKCFLEFDASILKTSIICSGATDMSPIDCYAETAFHVDGMTVIQASILCSGVTKANLKERVDCFYEVEGDSFNEIVLQCAGKGKKWKKYLFPPYN